jgi:hypothetical protein
MLEGIFNSSMPATLPIIFPFVMKFLQPVASLLARVNIESTVAVAALRLYELITRKADLSDEVAVEQKKRLEISISELLTNYKRWCEGSPNFNHADRRYPGGN